MNDRWNAALKELDEKIKTPEDAIREFFKILDSKEESDSGRVFSPVYISSCRVWESKKLETIIKRMREYIK